MSRVSASDESITAARPLVAATISIVSHGHGRLMHELLTDLSNQIAIDRCLVVITLNLKDESFDPSIYGMLSLRVIRNSIPKGFGANHNQAFRHACGTRFLVVNPDIRMPQSDTLSRLLEHQQPEVLGLRAPVVVAPNGEPEDSIRRNLTPWALIRRMAGLDHRPLIPSHPSRIGSDFYWVAGMFMAIDTAAFVHLRGFDERYYLYCEDYDLCARLYSSGYQIAVDSRATVIHAAQRDSHRRVGHLRLHLQSLLRTWCSRPFWQVSMKLYCRR